MCRHLGWVGAPVALASLLLEPPHSLARQAYAPRHQRHGVVNADGFGVGWYVTDRPEPVRYRRAQPIWADASFASLAPTVRTGCLLGAVRDATPGFASADETAAAPFVHGRWLFSHNGALADWAAARKALLDRTLDVPEAGAAVDSALLFGVAVTAWQAGDGLAEGLERTAAEAARVGGGRLAFLATDGTGLAATTDGDPLFVHERDEGVLLASEPLDDDPGWRALPDRSVVRTTATGVEVRPLDVTRPGAR